MSLAEALPGRRGGANWLALLPGLLFMLVFFLLPSLRLLQISFFHHEQGAVMTPGFTLEHYVVFLTDPFYLSKIWLTVKISAVVTVVTLLLSYPVAYLLVRGRFVGKGVLIGLVLSPLLTNFVVLVFAWILLLGPNSFVVKGLHWVFQTPVKLLYAPAGLVIALVHVSIPFAMIPLIASIVQVREDLEEAAISLGAGPWRAFFLVVLPLTLPGALAAAFVTVSIVLSGFAFALFIGGDSVLIVPLLIWQAVRATLNWPLAAAMSLASFVLVMLILALSLQLAGLAKRRVRTS